MASRLADHLNAARRHRFVGREAERGLLLSALTAEALPFYVLHVIGPGGVGKTTLLQEFASLCEQHQAKAIGMDARNLEAAPDAFVLSLQLAMGLTSEIAPLEALAHLNSRHVIFIDTYEKLAPLDGWLREVFLPQLSENVLVVIAGRDRLSARWRTDPGWNKLIRTVSLRNLSPEESRSYLNQRQVPADQHKSVLEFTRGHPLALSLVADAFDQRSGMQFLPEEAPDVIKALLERFVQKVPSPAHRTALAACALLHLTTEPLLAEMLAIADSHELFDWLRSLSFIEYGKSGLYPHDLVREALAADLRWRNPDWYAELHHRARSYYVKRLQQTRDEEQRRVLFEYIFLHRQNPVVRPVYDWQESGNVWTDVARANDVPILLEMVERHEGPESARLASYWLDRHLQSVQIYRGAQQAPTGFMMLLTLQQASEEMLSTDVALRKAWEYLHSHARLRPGEKLTYFRFWMAGESYQSVSPTQGRIFINAVQHYFSTPGLAFTFFPCAQPELWEKVFAYADLARLPELDFQIGGRRYGVFGHDWRAIPPMAWLDLLAGRELSQSEEYSPSPPTRATIVLSEVEFASAVHEALRAFTHPQALRQSPLLQSRVVMEQAGVDANETSRLDALLELIQTAAESLKASPRDEKFYRALHRTFFNPAESQELAAEALHMAFSTYRRYLKTGITRVTEILWQKEIGM